jgi:hypothetical protein
MSEPINVINRAINEHHEIKDTVPLTAESITDVEALFLLTQAYAGWVQAAARDLPEKQAQLVETLTAVERGLRQHWDYEEKELPPIFGDVLMKAFLIEHNDIAAKIKKARTDLSGTQLKGLRPTERVARKTVLETSVNRVIQAIEEHNRHEETILRMVKKALAANSKA